MYVLLCCFVHDKKMIMMISNSIVWLGSLVVLLEHRACDREVTGLTLTRSTAEYSPVQATHTHFPLSSYAILWVCSEAKKETIDLASRWSWVVYPPAGSVVYDFEMSTTVLHGLWCPLVLTVYSAVILRSSVWSLIRFYSCGELSALAEPQHEMFVSTVLLYEFTCVIIIYTLWRPSHFCLACVSVFSLLLEVYVDIAKLLLKMLAWELHYCCWLPGSATWFNGGGRGDGRLGTAKVKKLAVS